MTRRTSWGLLALVLAWCAAAPGAWAALRPIQGAVAVGDLRVDIDNQWVDYRKLTPEAMEESLTRLGQFSNVVGHARMSAKLPAVPTQAELMTAARELKADFVVSSTLKNLLENEEKGQLFIELETDLFEVATGERVGTSLVRGASSPKPGFAGGKNVLVQEAVYNAAEHAVAEIRSSTAMQGTVSIVQNAEQVFVTLAEVNTVAPGAYIGIYGDKGNKLGLVEVGDAGIAQASGKLVQRKPGMLIRQGQSARVEYVPSPTFQEFLTVVEQTKPRKKKGGSSMLIGLLGVGAVAVLLGVGQNKKDAATTEKAKIAGKIGCSNCPPGETASVTIPSSANNVVLPTIKTTTTFPSLPNNGFLNQASSVFDFKPDGLQFNSAVTLAIGFQDADKNFCVDGKTDPTDTSNTDGDPIGCVNTNKLQLYTYDPNRQEWVLVEGSSVTTTGSDTRVSASVQHFSLYVILENEAPAPPQPPQAVSVNCTSPTDVKLVWNPSTSTDVAFYNIYECTSLGGGCGTTPLVGGIGVTTQDVGDLATNQIRYFSVSAVDSLGQEGTKSGIVAAQQCKVVPTPSLISPTGNERVNTKTPTLTFKGSVDNEEGYFLEVINRSPNPANAAQEIVTLMWQVRVCNSGSIISSGGCSSGTTPGTGEQSTSGSVSTPITISLTYGGAALVTGTSYEWRVCSLDTSDACISDGPPSWTPYGKFNVGGTGGCTAADQASFLAPQLVEPANNDQTVLDGVRFAWTQVDGANGYDLVIRNAQGVIWWTFSSEVEGTGDGSPEANVIYPSGQEAPPFKDNQQYFWTVTSRNVKGCSAKSDTFSFTKVPIIVEGDKPEPPTWTGTPATGGNQLVVLRWNPNTEQNLDGYRIYRVAAEADGTVDTGLLATANPIATVRVDQLNAATTNPNCPQGSAQTPVYCDESVINGVKYFYALRAFNESNESSDLSVNVSVQLQLQRPVLVSPGGVLVQEIGVPATAGGATPTFGGPFVFLAVNGAAEYTIEVVNETTNRQVAVSTTSGTTNTLSFNVDNNAIYSWTVTAKRGQVVSEPSENLRFKIIHEIPGTSLPSVPNITADPVSGQEQVKLTWTQATGTNAAQVDRYIVQRSSIAAPTTYVTVGELPKNTGGNYSFTDKDDALRCDTTYFYKVLAVDVNDKNGPPPPGGPKEVTIPLLAPVYQTPPDLGFVSDPNPSLNWSPVRCAVEYVVQVGDVNKQGQDLEIPANLIWNVKTTDTSINFGDPAFPAPSKQLKNNVSRTDPPPQGVPLEAHPWRIGAVGPRTKTPAYRTAFKMFKFLPNPVQVSPVSPQGGTVNSAPRITVINPELRWNAVKGAVGYVVRVCRGAGKCGLAQNVIWEYEMNQQNQVKVEYNTDGNGETLQNCILEGVVGSQNCVGGVGVYSWQVRAVDENGTLSDLGWGSSSVGADKTEVTHQTFIKFSQGAPRLFSPTDGQVIQPDPTSACFVDPDAEDFDEFAAATCDYSIEFTWGSLGGEGERNYIIQVTEQVDIASGGTPTVVWKANVSCCSVPFGAGGELQRKLQPGTRYFWNVAADVPGGNAPVEFDPTNESSFITGLPFPRLLTPLDNSLAILNSGLLSVRFQWEEIPGASAYDIHIFNVTLQTPLTGPDAQNGCLVTGADLGSEGAKTRVNTPTFICTADSALAGFEDGHVFKWRVRAVDGLTNVADPGIQGNPGPWSEERFFKAGVNGPVLASPPNQGATNPNDMPNDPPEEMQWVLYRDAPYFWSPIPDDNEAQYFFAVADDPSFLNIIWQSVGRVGGVLPPEFNVTNLPGALGQVITGYTPYTGQPTSTRLPLVNGTRYYWRVGACPSSLVGTAACGDRNSVGWIFSDTWHFYKRPQGVENIAVSMNPDATGTVYTVVISWDPPVDFSGAVADIDSSVPGIPPTQGGYFVRYPCENSENEAEPGNFLNRSATQVSFAVGCGQSEQQFCVQVVDQSRLMTFIGAKSPAGTSLFSTPECPQDDTGG